VFLKIFEGFNNSKESRSGIFFKIMDRAALTFHNANQIMMEKPNTDGRARPLLPPADGDVFNRTKNPWSGPGGG